MKNKFENQVDEISKLASESPEELEKSIEKGFKISKADLLYSLDHLGALIKDEKVSGEHLVKRVEAVRKIKELAEFIRTEVI